MAVAIMDGTWMQDNYADIGAPVYADESKQSVEVSLPHIINVENALAANRVISLMNAAENYIAANFGNVAGITVTYISNNPAVPFTYGSMLGSIITDPMHIGLIRVQANTARQLQQPISLLRNLGLGKFDGDGIYPTVYPNQFIRRIAYVEKEFSLDDNLSVSFTQNGATNPNVQLYFYQNASVSLGRAFSNQNIVQSYAKPQTGITQQTQIVTPNSYGLLLKSSNLL